MRGWKKANSSITTLDFRRAEQSFRLFMNLLGRITEQWPWREWRSRKAGCFSKDQLLKFRIIHSPRQEIMQKQKEVCINEQNSNAGRKHARDGNKDR